MSYFKSAEEIYKEMTSTLGDVDTSENNSFIYNSNMPAAMENSTVLLNLDEAIKKRFAKLALENGYSEDLELIVGELGIERKQATYAEIPVKFTGKTGTVLSKGSIVGTLDNRLYVTQADMTIREDGTGTCYVRANESGAKYNVSEGEICYLPIKYNGIVSVTNEKAYSDAYEEESDDGLYNRYMIKARTPLTSGNKHHYEQWALEVAGVGSAKVYPLWNGNGTVKVVITNSNARKANDDLVKAVYDNIEEERPIGATVTVISVAEKTINISANVKIKSDAKLDNIKNTYTNNVENYLKNCFENNIKIISILKLAALLVDIDEVIDSDYSNFKLNSSDTNIILETDEVAVLGTISLAEV